MKNITLQSGHGDVGNSQAMGIENPRSHNRSKDVNELRDFVNKLEEGQGKG